LRKRGLFEPAAYPRRSFCQDRLRTDIGKVEQKEGVFPPGFQYVRVTPTGKTGFKGGLNDIVGLEIHTNMTATGTLSFGGDGVAGSEAEQAAGKNTVLFAPFLI
jgi:hypothetical protein